MRLSQNLIRKYRWKHWVTTLTTPSMTDINREARQVLKKLPIERKGMKDVAPSCLHLILTPRLPGTFPPTLQRDPSPITQSGCRHPDRTQLRWRPPLLPRCQQRRTRRMSGPGPAQCPTTLIPLDGQGRQGRQDTGPDSPRLGTLARCPPPDKPPRTRKFHLQGVEEYKRETHCWGCTWRRWEECSGILDNVNLLGGQGSAGLRPATGFLSSTGSNIRKVRIYWSWNLNWQGGHRSSGGFTKEKTW